MSAMMAIQCAMKVFLYVARALFGSYILWVIVQQTIQVMLEGQVELRVPMV